MFLKKFAPALALGAAVLLAGPVHAEKLSVAATPVPHAELLEHIKPALAKEGVELDIKVFTDYVQPNQQVADGQIDVNFFQHQPYLDSFNKEHGTKLVTVGKVHVEPFGAYSDKIKDIKDLKDGAQVALPNDPSTFWPLRAISSRTPRSSSSASLKPPPCRACCRTWTWP
jgi:D-methionine transport system substrate-binding protein